MQPPSIAWLLDLRLRLRVNREATALVDRCLALVARAKTADEATLAALATEARRIGDDLALRCGAPKSAVPQ